LTLTLQAFFLVVRFLGEILGEASNI
jgi:hypothetical protein